MFLQGALMGAVTIIAFYIGLQVNSAVASTMAFATLTLARLFHGFNCRGRESIFELGLFWNIYSVGAFVIWCVVTCICTVCTIYATTV